MRRALLCAGFLACAHTPNLPLRPDPSPPPGSTTETITARDGTQLLARHWAATGDVKAAFVIMHGLKDYSARYADLASTLAARGYSVYAFDLRGHGRSAGPRVAPDEWTDYVDDLDRFLTDVEKREAGKPVYLFGHSMGGAIAARTAELHTPQVAGLVLSGPALAIDAPPLLLAATRMSGATTPKFPAFKLNNHDFSSDPKAGEAMDKDELVSQPPAPASTAAGLINGIEWIWTDIVKLTMPLLALHGTKDRLTAPAGSRLLIENAPAKDKTLRIYDGLFHDLIHEPNGKQVIDDVVAWVDGHVAKTPVAPPPMYAGELTGDPRGWSQVVSMAAGVSRAVDGGDVHFAGDVAVALARPQPIGWSGALIARMFGDGYAIALRPLGLGVRAGRTLFALSGGAALVTGTEFAGTGGLFIEQPLGPAHVSVRADYTHLFESGTPGLYSLIGALRFGGDRRYAPPTAAGVGPALVGAYDCVDGICAWSVLLGLHLYGVD